MTITQTVDIPADRWLKVKVPNEVPAGPAIIAFTPTSAASSHPCPICARHQDPETGSPRYNAETIAGMQEVEDMIAGKIPNKLKAFNTLEEMLEDLDSDD